jgi:hypothetical protein
LNFDGSSGVDREEASSKVFDDLIVLFNEEEIFAIGRVEDIFVLPFEEIDALLYVRGLSITVSL